MQPRVTLLVLAALCGAAMAREAPMSPAGRELLQLEADCKRSIPFCKTCRYQKFGTTTLTVCATCDTGYVVKNGGKSCWCAPGYKKSASDNTCITCATGLTAGTFAFCPGSKTSLVSANSIDCGANKQTISTVAKAERECVAKPGYGWALTDAVVCALGSYNPGMNNRACTKCPGGLTTSSTGSTSASACVAPLGYYYYRGKAVACAKGYFKAAIGNTDCVRCPVGFTTPGVGSYAASGADCTVLEAGYYVTAGDVPGTAVGTPCAANSWAAGNPTYSTAGVAGSATTCTSCGNCVTSPDLQSPNPAGQDATNAPGATSAAMCVAPPGFGYNAGACTACGAGTFNTGYNREACTSCGTNFQGSGNSTDACMIPAGSGTTRDASGALTVAACPANTYGRNTSTYGQVDVECTKCIDNTVTIGSPATGKTTPEACVTKPGYGYDNGAANACEEGYYAPGSTQDPCTYCGDGQWSPANSTSSAACGNAKGYTGTFGGDTFKACPVSTYKNTTGPGACTACSATGTLSTTRSSGATSFNDCDICAPGYGITNGTLGDGVATDCTKCASGTFYGGRVQNGTECSPCPFPDGVDFAVMVSKPGSLTSESCIRQFPTGNNSMSNGLEWDIISLDSSGYTVKHISNVAANSAYNSRIKCQETCAADANCQYFVWYDATLLGGVNDECRHRSITAVSPPNNAALTALTWDNAGNTFYVMFEVKEGQYVAYGGAGAADAAAIGGTAIATHATYIAAKTACDADLTCIGFNNFKPGSAGNFWRTFKGDKWAGAIGKVRVVGENINSFVA